VIDTGVERRAGRKERGIRRPAHGGEARELRESQQMPLIEVERKGKVLTKAQFGCLREVYTLNVTRGCEFRCVYCYARGYRGAPVSDEVHVYGNLPQKLAAELDNPRRRSEVPWVAFNTASDSFQTHPGILDVTYRAMEVLLERGVGISFLTKGWIPDRFIALFSQHPGLVTARIGLVSVSSGYQRLFEPRAATPAERLENIDRLTAADIDAEVRIDPIVPFYTDDARSIRRLLEALSHRGISTITVSYLHMRPPILDQLAGELPATAFRLLKSCFETQPWSAVGSVTRSKLIPLPLRKKGYDRFRDAAKALGMRTLICSCKNPDLPAHRCSTGIAPVPTGGQARGQLSLFAC
jgi:DNA repair photolyase